MKIGIIGCGFVADYYLATLPQHSGLELVGVADKDADRAQIFAAYHNIKAFPSVEALLRDAGIRIVLNLTDPRSHFDVSNACISAGKHVYSEKPLAMKLSEACELVESARRANLLVSSAPCSVLSASAQTVWRALRQNAIGTVRLVYAEMDDGMVHKMPYDQWISASGRQWPAKDEFEIGCVLEHAGYYLTWLTTFFGPAESVTSFSDCLVPNKMGDQSLSPDDTPDFSVACIKFSSGVVARLTCSIVAPHDHRLQIIGDEGVLGLRDCWYNSSPVSVRKLMRIRRKVFLSPVGRRIALVRKQSRMKYKGAQQMDFCLGVTEMAESIEEQRPCRIGTDFSLHNNELAIAISQSRSSGASVRMTTSFVPPSPINWAQ